jgi:hypothetical protein
MNVKPGELFEIFIDGSLLNIKCPTNFISGKNIYFKKSEIFMKKYKFLLNLENFIN